jgi:hypothetical protein
MFVIDVNIDGLPTNFLLFRAGVPPQLAAMSLAYNVNLFGSLTHYASGQAAVSCTCMRSGSFIHAEHLLQRKQSCSNQPQLQYSRQSWVVLSALHSEHEHQQLGAATWSCHSVTLDFRASSVSARRLCAVRIITELTNF